MAELLSIVAGGAGLVSLALQLVDGGQKLRNRYKSAKGLKSNVLWLSQDLELIGQQLVQIESYAPTILQQQLGPIMLERCRSRSASVAARLENLTEALPVSTSRSHLIRATFRSSQWKSELDELQCLVSSLKQDISQLYIVEHHVLMQRIRKQATIKSSECSLATAEPSAQVACNKSSTMVRQEISLCSICYCDCSCHKKRTINRAFWRLQYSPLFEMFRSCDSPACTVRHYHIDIRLALSHCGIPFKVTLGLGLISEPGRYTLQPSLEIETMVDYAAPQYVILENLATGKIGWGNAKIELRSLYKSNPRFVDHVNPCGQGCLEFAHYPFITSDSVYLYYLSLETLRSLYELFVNEFHTKEGHHSMGLLRQFYWVVGVEGKRDFVSTCVSMGCDFRDTFPTAESWMDFRGSSGDPVSINLLNDLLLRNPDFGDSPPLHYSVLHESDEDFAIQVKKASRPLEQHVNFLGHTALHLALYQPSRVAYLLAAGHEVDPRDKNGRTPLMYAAQVDIPDTAIKLIEHGACLIVDGFQATYSALRSANWDLFWKMIDFSTTMEPDMTHQLIPDSLGNWVHEPCYSAHESDGMRNGCLNFWTRLVSKVGGPNVLFDDGKTLMDLVTHPDHVRALIELGFDEFSHRNDHGENCLFQIVGMADLSLVHLVVANGADINVQNNSGRSVLHKLLDCIETSNGTDLVGLFETLDFLMDQGAHIPSGCRCSCGCSSGNHLPGSRLIGPPWLDFILGCLSWFEWLEILEERNMVVEAKSIALASLRRAYFAEAGLHHTSNCCERSLSGDEAEDSDGRFWDVSEQIKVYELDSRMRYLAEKDYPDVKLEAMAFLHRSWMTTRAGQRCIWKLKRHEKVNLEKARMDIMLPILDVIQNAKSSEIPEPLSTSWKRSIQQHLDADGEPQYSGPALSIARFGICLYRLGNDRLKRRLPLLAQLTDILVAEDDIGL